MANTFNGLTSEVIERVNSHALTAHLLVSEHAQRVEDARRHDDELAKIRATLGDAQRIGLAVMRAKRAGRKTVRVAELIDDEDQS